MAFDGKQEQRDPEVMGKLRDGVFQGRESFTRFRGRRRVRFPHWQVVMGAGGVQRIRHTGLPVSFAARMVAAEIGRNRIEPRHKFGPGLEPVNLKIDAHESSCNRSRAVSASPVKR